MVMFPPRRDRTCLVSCGKDLIMIPCRSALLLPPFERDGRRSKMTSIMTAPNLIGADHDATAESSMSWCEICDRMTLR